ncbi:MAG: outer membrane protein assembly factor BamA [Bacteroidales bacterium]
MKKYILIFLLFPVIQVWGQVDYQIKKIEIQGNVTLDNSLLFDQMNTRDMNIGEHLLFWKMTPQYSPIILENDVERLKSFYQRNGFLDAQVNKELTVNDKRRQVSIALTIQEGKPMMLRSSSVREVGKKQTGILEEVRNKLPVKVNERFEDRKVYTAMAQISQAYKNKGYPFVRVDKNIQVDTAKHSANLSFQVFPGKKSTFGHVTFQGDSLVSEHFLRQKLHFKTGELYSQEKLDKSQEVIFETGLFNYVVIRGQKDSVINGKMPVLIRLNELPQWSFKGGVGYGTEDRFRVSSELIKRQFLGGARKLILEAKRSYFLPVSVDAKFIQPNLFNKELDFVLNPFFIREREKSYEVDRLGTGLTLQKNFTQTLSAFLTYSMEHDYLIDKTLSDTLNLKDRRTYNKSGITIGVNKNSTDNIFEPTKGWKIDGYYTYMGLGFQSEYRYYKIALETRHYKKVSRGYVFAGKLHGGIIEPLEKGGETPLEDRFLIGGGSSLRGWSRHSLSPKNKEGKAIGGNTMLEGSLELRFPVYDILSGAVFVDAGNVWKNPMHFDLNDLYYDAGLGLRVKTPIGPVRLDMAYPVFNEKSKGQFYISLGHAF